MATSMEFSSTRSRRNDALSDLADLIDDEASDDKQRKSSSYLLDSHILWGVVIAFLGLQFLFIRHRLTVFPYPKTQERNSPVDVFYESNAREHLESIVSHGPRVAGSEANEIHAYNYILKQLQEIQKVALPSHNVSVDEHLVSGGFDLAFLSDFVSVYDNLKNIVAKIEPAGGSEHSVMINCHYDSAIGSPGAGDNAISCAVMIEMLRVLSQSSEQLPHGIVFLFNGAEENILQASHGFITQHPTSDSIKAFVNVDSAGAGGWETVFQTGPAHPWLVRAYAQSSPHPAGSILGQEMFQSGLIPSDTDYRIFRDFGELPGLDVAYISNGYVYHTPFDQARFIEPGCIQRGGENLLALLRKLASSPKLADPGLDKHGVMIFFDVVGLIMIFYPQRIGVVINSALIAAVFFKLIRKCIGDKTKGLSGMRYLRGLVTAVFHVLLSWLAIAVVSVGVALLMTILGRNMSWFTHNMNVVGLFILPATTVVMAMHQSLKKNFYKDRDPWEIELLFFEGNLLIWSCLTLVATMCGVGSAFFPMLYILGPLLIRDRTMQVFRNRHWKSKSGQFLALHLASLSLPYLMTVYNGYVMFRLFIPIMGRTGTEINSDIFLAVVTSLQVIMLAGYLVGLCYICRSLERVIGLFGIISVVWILAILVTPLGFPFSGNKDYPTPERVFAVHADRRILDKSGSMTYNDSGILLLSFDMTEQAALRSTVPMMKGAQTEKCMSAPYCGQPYLLPVLQMFQPQHTFYIPAAKLEVPPVPCVLTDRQVVPGEYSKLKFRVSHTGPDHITLYIRPKPNVTLINWTLATRLTDPVHMPPGVEDTNYFVYYSYGTKPAAPWEFALYFQTAEDVPSSEAVVEMGIAGHYLHGNLSVSRDMQRLLDQLPDWTAPLTVSATYTSYEF